MKGYMTAVRGSCWIMEEQLSDTGFDSPFSLKQAEGLDETVKEMILGQIKFDMYQVLPTNNENVYGYGKQVARIAQLVHIADVLEAPDSLFNELMSQLYSFVVDFLTGDVGDYLLYDENLGGMVSVDGLSDSGGDFGNGWYNDHHFHYGYILYACGILGKYNTTFASEYGSHVDSIMYDVAFSENSSSNNSLKKPSFPFTRHKSWYDGHSYASGLFPFADGKSQESSTESINCYYGAYLWSSVRSSGDSNVIDFARLLLATEIRSVKLYWHMNSDGDVENVYNNPSVYNPIFAKSLMVGNSGMMDVTVSTWFGTNPLYVHMINFMPITAITREVFDKDYIENEFNQIIKPIYDGIEAAWKGYAVCDRALIEPTEAWNDALKLQSNQLDQAISLSQILFFIATMDGFSITASSDEIDIVPPSSNSSPGHQSPTNSKSETSDLSSCAANSKCSALGLKGLCCPTPSGTTLSCCDSVA